MPPKRRQKGRTTRAKRMKAEDEINNILDNPIKDVMKKEVKASLELEHCKSNRQKSYADLMKKRSTLTCKKCNKRFRFKKSYKTHLLMEHSTLPGSIACNSCSVRCPDKETLEEHIENIHNRDIFVCKYCNKEFVRRSHVLRHMEQKGCGGHGILYPCKICSRTFSRKDNLIVHLRTKHIAKVGFGCKQCPYHTKLFSKLIAHFIKNHSGTPNHYECHHCGKVNSSRAAIAKHMEIHGDKKFSCDVCGYATYTIEVIRRHVLTHVEERPYKCSLCPRSYIQRSQLKRHLERHAGLDCTTCGKTFKFKNSLIFHQKTHLGMEKLICTHPECSISKRQFVNEESLAKHMALHENEKAFPCDVCKKTYGSEVNMRRHMLTHKLDRPRRCMYCVQARAYVRGEQLVRHVRMQHSNIFKQHLQHVRNVLGINVNVERVKKSELESILNLLDAESDRIMDGYGESGVLYGGIQEDEDVNVTNTETPLKNEENPLMSEEELTESLKNLLIKLVDQDMLQCFGWPEKSVDVVLEKVIEQCGARAADRTRWTRVQCLRENTKHLFLYVIEDNAIARMLGTHTIDQIVKHILQQVDDDNTAIQTNQ